MESGRNSHHSMPLVSRLDHMDFMIKYLERKQNLTKRGSDSSAQGLERECVPMDLAAKEAYFKGSLLDRVASLEDRLFRLCLEMGSSSTPHSSAQTSWETSSSHGSKGESSCSLPTFNNLIPRDQLISQIGANRLEIQGQPLQVQKRLKHPSPTKQRLEKKRPNKDEKICKSGKKGISSNWPHFKILGC